MRASPWRLPSRRSCGVRRLPWADLAWCVSLSCAPLATRSEAAAEDQGEEGRLHEVGFKNRYYPVIGYQGSRVLEYNETGRFASYVEVLWSQAASVDQYTGRTWFVDRVYHQVLMLEPKTLYLNWPAYLVEYAGARGVPGHLDGSRREAKFRSPSGLAVYARKNGPPMIFVSDTNNHCIRRIQYETGQTSTIVGLAGRPGLRDGYGSETRFRYPSSMGVDSTGENMFVLDNGRRVRHIDISQKPASVATLVGGACRTVSHQTIYTIKLRTVGCHSDWNAIKAGETDVEYSELSVICVGHAASCSPRRHPALSDVNMPRMSPLSENTVAGPVVMPGEEIALGSQDQALRRLFASPS